jgi:hypothetical protein
MRDRLIKTNLRSYDETRLLETEKKEEWKPLQMINYGLTFL